MIQKRRSISIIVVFIVQLLFCFHFNKLQAQLNKSSLGKKSIVSIDTEYTISKVRTANTKNKRYIVASTYEGTLLGVSYDGKILWKHELSGFMNHDVWCS